MNPLKLPPYFSFSLVARTVMVTAKPDVGKVSGVTDAMTGATSGAGGAAFVAACVTASSSHGNSRNSPIAEGIKGATICYV